MRILMHMRKMFMFNTNIDMEISMNKNMILDAENYDEHEYES